MDIANLYAKYDTKIRKKKMTVKRALSLSSELGTYYNLFRSDNKLYPYKKDILIKHRKWRFMGLKTLINNTRNKL